MVLGILEKSIGKNNWRNSQWHIIVHLNESCRKHEGLNSLCIYGYLDVLWMADIGKA
jgi:hypothetical protein